MQNIEYKTELRNPEIAPSICEALGARFIIELEQTDTYFRVPHGRLKKREAPGEPTEFIQYERKDSTLPKLSHFTIYSEEMAIERFGTQPLPIWVIVKKKRKVYMLANVRIHIDQVEGLGSFLELEALVSREFNVVKCHEALNKLIKEFRPTLGEPIATGYADLIAAETQV